MARRALSAAQAPAAAVPSAVPMEVLAAQAPAAAVPSAVPMEEVVLSADGASALEEAFQALELAAVPMVCPDPV